MRTLFHPTLVMRRIVLQWPYQLDEYLIMYFRVICYKVILFLSHVEAISFKSSKLAYNIRNYYLVCDSLW